MQLAVIIRTHSLLTLHVTAHLNFVVCGPFRYECVSAEELAARGERYDVVLASEVSWLPRWSRLPGVGAGWKEIHAGTKLQSTATCSRPRQLMACCHVGGVSQDSHVGLEDAK